MLSLYDYVYDSLPLFDRSFFEEKLYLRGVSSDYRIEKNDDKLLISVDMPGVKSDDLQVSEEDNYINIQYTLRGEKYTKKYSISKLYDISTAKAKLENGVLEVSIEKAKEEKKKNIEVLVIK